MVEKGYFKKPLRDDIRRKMGAICCVGTADKIKKWAEERVLEEVIHETCGNCG